MKTLTESINDNLINEELDHKSANVYKEYSRIQFEWMDKEEFDIDYVNKIIDVNWDPEDEEGENLDENTISIARIINNSTITDDLKDEHLWLAYMEKVLIVSDGTSPLNRHSDGADAVMYIIYKDQPTADKNKMLKRMKAMEKTKLTDD